MTDKSLTFASAKSAPDALASLMNGNAIDPKLVSAAIRNVANTGKTWQMRVHAAAVACIYLSMSVEEGGPATGAQPFIDLMNAMPKGSNAKKLAAWAAEFSNIRVRWDKKAGAFTGGVIGSKLKSYATPRPNDAMATPFYEMGKDERETVDTFTADTLKRRVASIIKAAKADNAKLNAKGKAALADLEAAMSKLTAIDN